MKKQKEKDKIINGFINGNDELSKLLDKTLNKISPPKYLTDKTKNHILKLMREEKEKTKIIRTWYIPASIAASVLIVFIVGKAMLVGPEIQIYDLAETEESDDDQKSSDVLSDIPYEFELSDIPYELANVAASNNDQIEQEDMIDEINQLWHEGKKKEAETMLTEFMKKYSDYPKDELEKKLDF